MPKFKKHGKGPYAESLVKEGRTKDYKKHMGSEFVKAENANRSFQKAMNAAKKFSDYETKNRELKKRK